MDKYRMVSNETGFFNGGIHIDLNFITLEDNNIIMPILQSYVLHWHHMYLVHPGMDRTEAII